VPLKARKALTPTGPREPRPARRFIRLDILTFQLADTGWHTQEQRLSDDTSDGTRRP